MNFIIVGAGISGAVVARVLAENGHSIKIIDRRNHIAGNIYDYVDDFGILIQKYGPHIFHTSDETVYDFITQFSQWNPFKLECGASWDGKYSPTPFNFSSVDIFFDEEKANLIKSALKSSFNNQPTATVVELLNCENQFVKEFAEYLFENDYAPYTAKQWGMEPSKVSKDVLKRVPIRLSYDTGYFSDKYELMPKHGFTQFVNNLLGHSNISVSLNTEANTHFSFINDKVLWDNDSSFIIVYTGAIDELFECKFGKLPYRSLKFDFIHSEKESIQKAPVVAYPKAELYTRITEYNKLPKQITKGSTYAIEYPLTYSKDKQLEPYYPVSTENSESQFNKYKEEADKFSNLYICGRLANFKYYNMDQAIKNALNVSHKILSEMKNDF